MAKEKEESGMSVNLRLTEALTEKVLVILLSSFLSFSSGVVYANYNDSNLSTNTPPKEASNIVK
jgi:hypothetical protein